MVEAEASRHGVPTELVLAVIAQESNFDPMAVGDDGESKGLMQLNVGGAAAQYGLPFDDDSVMFDPLTSIRYGTMYLAEIIKRLGVDPNNPDNWLAIYQEYMGGPGGSLNPSPSAVRNSQIFTQRY